MGPCQAYGLPLFGLDVASIMGVMVNMCSLVKSCRVGVSHPANHSVTTAFSYRIKDSVLFHSYEVCTYDYVQHALLLELRRNLNAVGIGRTNLFGL